MIKTAFSPWATMESLVAVPPAHHQPKGGGKQARQGEAAGMIARDDGGVSEIGPLDPTAPRWTRRQLLGAAIASGALVACGGGKSGPAPSPTPATPTRATTTPSATLPPPSATATLPAATRTVPPLTATATATADTTLAGPRGFPLDTSFALGLVTGDVGRRSLSWSAGPGALEYSRDDQPSTDPVRANRSGWNARVHVEYEGRPAVDWYVPPGTPVRATLAGEATLYVITVENAFDVYGVSREPYIGDPDRSRAPLNAFPGPGGGMGVFVRVVGDGYRADYAHLQLLATARELPAGSMLDGFRADDALIQQFTPMRDYRDWTAVARWQVRRGDLLGLSGDSGYSEAPHLHYAIAHADGTPMCPTAEPGVADGGWLFA